MASKRPTLKTKDSKLFRESVFEVEQDKSSFSVGGYLLKKGSNVVTPWQSRYFAASGHYLKYYKSKDVSKKKDYCLAVIDLDLCEIKDPSDKVFEIVLLESEKTILKANSADEAMKWVAALRTVQTLYKENVEAGQQMQEEDEDVEEEEDVGEDTEEFENGLLLSQKSIEEQEASWLEAEAAEAAILTNQNNPSILNPSTPAPTTTTTTPTVASVDSSKSNAEISFDEEVASLLHVKENTHFKTELLEGGATGKTYRLSASEPNGGDKDLCLRKLDDGEAESLIKISQILGEANIAPKVIASNHHLLISELVNASSVTVTSLGLNEKVIGDQLENVADLVAKLHKKIPKESIDFIPSRDESSYWLQKALHSLPNLSSDIVQQLKHKVEQINLIANPSTLIGVAGMISTTHGDLHPGNILISSNSSSAWLVDFEHVGPRPVGFDLGYFFAVWGDLTYMAGWKPSEERPVPYPSYEARKVFASRYLKGMGEAASKEGVDDFLFQIEVAGLRERLRLMLIWILISKGDVNHMMVGAVSVFLPHLDKAIALYQDIAQSNDASLRATVCEKGLLVAAITRKDTPVPPVTETPTSVPPVTETPTPVPPVIETPTESAPSGESGGGPSMSEAPSPSPSLTSASPLPSVKRLSKKPMAEELKRQEVPDHLKPNAGEVNDVSTQALKTAPIGQERKVTRRRSVTSRRCLAGDLMNAPCSCFHFRDSPFCHDHAYFDPESVRISAGGTSEMEDVLNKALEVALDHVIDFPPEAQSEGEAILATLPSNLATEFSDPLECYQLKRQFLALLSFSGDTGDGLLQAEEVLSCAKNIGDDLDPEKVNIEWANTLVAGVLGRDDNSPGDEGVDLIHFMDCIRQMRTSMGVDKRSVSQNVKRLKMERLKTAGAGGGGGGGGGVENVDDVESDEEDEDEEATLSPWHYPVHVPEGASPGTILTIPLPGGEVGYAPVEDDNAPGTVVKVPMTAAAVAGCVKQAVEDASSGNAARATEMPAETMTSLPSSRRVSCIEGAPDEPGIGAVYAAIKGRQRFSLNAFLALREASALATDLPKMEGYMLKRGDAMSMGYLNSWKLRYFRLEGNELVYYEKEPTGDESAASKFQVNKQGNTDAVQQAKDKAASQGREATDKELAAAMVEEQNVEVFKDKNCKGGINMSEIVDIQFSIKTPVSVSGARLMVNKRAPGSDEPALSSDLKGGELAEAMVVFKVTSAKMRRYVLAVPYDNVIQVMSLFAKHVHFARASLRFRREFGSGVKQALTLSDRIQWAASTHGAKIALAGLMIVYQNKYLRDNVLNYNLYSIGPINITPARIILAMVVTKTAHDVYISAKYANREKKYGIKWQYKKDVFHCNICESKFPTIAVRKEHQKHHCRMCGRVVCHACASTLLFYEASGKRQRTCDYCIKHGGPPDSCKALASNQKTVFELAAEEKRKADAKKKEEAGGSQAQAAIIERNQLKTTELADWCDWGVCPGTAPDLSKRNKNTAATGGGSEMAMKYEFSVFVPKDAQPGDTIEVTLPDGVNKVITYVVDSKPSDRQKVSIGFGKDGVFFALPPKGGYDKEAMEAAKQRKEVNAAQMATNALKTANSIINAASDAKDMASMAGLKF